MEWTLSGEEGILDEWVYHCFQTGELGIVLGDEDVDRLQLERWFKRDFGVSSMSHHSAFNEEGSTDVRRHSIYPKTSQSNFFS